jgi:hypothetical protein
LNKKIKHKRGPSHTASFDSKLYGKKERKHLEMKDKVRSLFMAS